MPVGPWMSAGNADASSSSTPKQRARLLGRRQASVDGLPLHVLEERVDVLGRGGAVVDCVRVLVHVHDEEGQSASERLRVIAGPVAPHIAGQEVVVDDGPAAAAAQALSEGAEVLLPSPEPAVAGRQLLLDGAVGLAVAAQIPEV